MAELADAPDLGSGGAIHGGSSPPFRTNNLRIFAKLPFSTVPNLRPPKKTVPTGLLVRVPAMPRVPLAGMPALSGLRGGVSGVLMRLVPFPRPVTQAIAVLQLLYTETTPQSGFFLKKKPPSIESVRTYVLENRSKTIPFSTV